MRSRCVFILSLASLVRAFPCRVCKAPAAWGCQIDNQKKNALKNCRCSSNHGSIWEIHIENLPNIVYFVYFFLANISLIRTLQWIKYRLGFIERKKIAQSNINLSRMHPIRRTHEKVYSVFLRQPFSHLKLGIRFSHYAPARFLVFGSANTEYILKLRRVDVGDNPRGYQLSINRMKSCKIDRC